VNSAGLGRKKKKKENRNRRSILMSGLKFAKEAGYSPCIRITLS